MEITIRTNNQDQKEILKKYAVILSKMMYKLEKKYKLQLPKSIILRPMQKRKYTYHCSMGRAGYTPNIGYWIALNMNYYKINFNKSIIDTLAEEAAHLATKLLNGNMHHDSLLWEMKMFLNRRWKW